MSDEYTAKYARIPNITPGILDALLGEYNVLKPWLTGEPVKRITPENMDQWATDLAIGATFAGPKAKTANLSKLAQAEKMAAEGIDNEAIRQATDWFQGMDKKWRFEIDDSGAKALRNPYPPNFMNQAAKEAGFSDYISIPMAERGPINTRASELKTAHVDPFEEWGPMGNHISHDALFEAYPQLRDADARVNREARANGTAYEDGRIEYGGGTIGSNDRSVLLHELQHAIQEREGFATGGSPSAAEWASPSRRPLLLKTAKQTLEEWKPATYEQFWGKEVTPEGQIAYAKYVDEFNTKGQQAQRWMAAQQGAPGKIYQNLAGEIEARDVSARMDMTPEQRSATPPALQKDAIVRFGKGDQAGGLMQSLASQAQDPSNSIVAHIMPSEAKALERRNGGGSINPITGLPEFWSDGGGEEDGDSIGGGRRGGNEGFSDTERGSSWGGGDDSGGWGGYGDSIGSALDGISNVDATRAREAQADMLGGADSLRGTVDRAARGEIFSDDQERQDRVKGMWDKTTSFQEYPGMSSLERGWNKLTRADNVVSGVMGLLGSATGIPGLGFGLSKLGGYLARDLTPASTVANLGRTKGTVGAGYAGFGGVPTDAEKSYGMGRTAGADLSRVAGISGGLMGQPDSGYGGDSPTFETAQATKETEAEKKKREEEAAKKQKEEREFLAKLFGVDLGEQPTETAKIEADPVKIPGVTYYA